jgi:hypothetical protein
MLVLLCLDAGLELLGYDWAAFIMGIWDGIAFWMELSESEHLGWRLLLFYWIDTFS